ncbi:ABC transporter permease, partial [Desulfovibrio sp. OttesenSCG-928-G11]|nr:ABC transporter permease [Desulfovibrio sp. OttesenSCG-928-G11]
NFWDVYAIHAAEGRLFTAADDEARSRVCVLGEELARRLFGKGPYVGRSLTIFSDNYMVIGVAGGVLTRAWRDRCFVPMTTASDRFVASPAIKANRIVLRTGHLEDIAPLLKRMPDILLKTQGTPYDLVTYENARDELSNVRLIVSRVNIILQLGIFAALGLGGFGIWQSSFASVRERTQEIGLQLAMGAEQMDIVKQFLGESLFNALLGGLVGVVIGVTGVIILCLLYELPAPWLPILINLPLCLIVSALVGAVGGTWPAIQAGRMDVATALRFE